jgi:hypothetical protein
MGKIIDISGHKYGRWTVLKYSHLGKHNKAYWLCRCDCGVERVISTNTLRRGASTSCGCAHVDAITRHILSGSSTYRSWAMMRRRCEKSHDKDYKDYGGRGITVCGRWSDFTFFLRDMG